MPEQVLCDTQSLVSRSPCLSCLSESQLWAVILYAISQQTDYSLPEDTGQLLADSSCLNCLTDKQLLESLAGILAEIYVEDKTVEQIRDAITCLFCTSPKQLKSAIAYLLCQTQFMNSRILDSGLAHLSGGTATVTNVNASASNPILLSYYSLNGNQATITYGSIVAGTSFVITSSNGSDTNWVAWSILKP